MDYIQHITAVVPAPGRPYQGQTPRDLYYSWKRVFQIEIPGQVHPEDLSKISLSDCKVDKEEKFYWYNCRSINFDYEGAVVDYLYSYLRVN
jgi:hypothetical protein